jgi:hypothetical protein
MALKKQEVIIEFNAETNEAVSSVEELEGSYGQLEQKIEDVARAQETEGKIAKDRDKQRKKEADNIKKTVDKIAEAEKKRAAIEKGGIAERDEGSSQYIGDLNEINNNLSKVTQGQTGFLSTAISGFDTLKQGISGATGGFGLMKTAISATGIGLLVTAAFEFLDFAVQIYDTLKDKSAQQALEYQLETQTDITEEAQMQLEIAQARGASQYKTNQLQRKAIQAEQKQLEVEMDLAAELEDEERILAAQNRLKELQRDLTINQIDAEQMLADRLEESRRAADDDYRERAERAETTADEEAALVDNLEKQAEIRQRLIDFSEYGEDITLEQAEVIADANYILAQGELQLARTAGERASALAAMRKASSDQMQIAQDIPELQRLLEEQAALEEIIANFKEAQNAADREEAELAEEQAKRDAERIGRRGAFRTYEEEERKQLQVAREQLNKDLIIGEQMVTEAFETESDKRMKKRQEEYELFRDFVLKDEETMLNAGKQGLQILNDLNEAFAGETEEQQRKGFERAKKIQAAQTLISTYEATMAAYKSVVGTPFVGPALAPIVAATVAATGLKNVRNIMNQEFEGSGPAPDTGRASIRNVSGPTAPTIDLSFLGQGAQQQEPIRAYVLSGDVSNAQQANQKIQDQATL